MHRKYHMEITHVEHTRRSKTQNRHKRPKKAIFGGFKALAKSGVEVLKTKKFLAKFKVFMLCFIEEDQAAKECLVLELEIFEVRCAIPP